MVLGFHTKRRLCHKPAYSRPVTDLLWVREPGHVYYWKPAFLFHRLFFCSVVWRWVFFFLTYREVLSFGETASALSVLLSFRGVCMLTRCHGQLTQRGNDRLCFSFRPFRFADAEGRFKTVQLLCKPTFRLLQISPALFCCTCLLREHLHHRGKSESRLSAKYTLRTNYNWRKPSTGCHSHYHTCSCLSRFSSAQPGAGPSSLEQNLVPVHYTDLRGL